MYKTTVSSLLGFHFILALVFFSPWKYFNLWGRSHAQGHTFYPNMTKQHVMAKQTDLWKAMNVCLPAKVKAKHRDMASQAGSHLRSHKMISHLHQLPWDLLGIGEDWEWHMEEALCDKRSNRAQTPPRLVSEDYTPIYTIHPSILVLYTTSLKWEFRVEMLRMLKELKERVERTANKTQENTRVYTRKEIQMSRNTNRKTWPAKSKNSLEVFTSKVTAAEDRIHKFKHKVQKTFRQQQKMDKKPQNKWKVNINLG